MQNVLIRSITRDLIDFILANDISIFELVRKIRSYLLTDKNTGEFAEKVTRSYMWQSAKQKIS